MSNTKYEFGNQPPYMADSYTINVANIENPYKTAPVGHYPGHDLLWSSVNFYPPTINTDNYHSAIEDINRSWTTIEDPTSGKIFEVARANILDNNNLYDAELSTFTSSLSGNPGNAVEFAENAALHPDYQRLYIASFGNGGSSYWDSQERKYIRSTGRFTQPDGEALPTIQALERALKAADFIIRRFSTNSAGGAYATSLMAALPEGQVSRAYIKSRPNISNHRSPLLWGASVLVGDIVDDKRYRQTSEDPWKLTEEIIDDAKDHLPNLYSDEAQNLHKTLFQKAKSSHSISKLITDMIALSRGGVAYQDPAARDTVNALRRQPEALITYHFPLQDRLYNDLQDLRVFLNATYDLGRTAASSLFTGQIEALVMPGAHRDHTHYPSLRWAAERYAFNRTVNLDRIKNT